jgi:hypothetical protein
MPGSGAARTRTVSDALWVQMLAALVALRVLIPLVVLAAGSSKLPLVPDYDYRPLNGDAYGFYHAVANIFAAFSGVLLGWIGAAALVLMICFTVAAVILWRGGVRWLAVLLPPLAVTAITGVLVHDMATPGAGVVGWPLVWALSLSPLPVFHVALTPDRAFPTGLAISAIANAVTVVATAFVGLRATGRRSVGLMAAGLYATWPLWVGIVAGTRAWENGQWQADVGLHLYTEPPSTALVVVSLALLLHPRLSALTAAVTGLLLGFATAVKLTNGFVAASLVVIVAFRFGARRAAIVALGGLVSAPIVFGYWSRGYVDASGGRGVELEEWYRWAFVSANARASLIFTGTMLVVIVPLAVVGVWLLGDWYRRAVLIVPILVTIASFAAYYATGQHPRFYYVILPSLFVLQAAGGALIWEALRPRIRLGAASEP